MNKTLLTGLLCCTLTTQSFAGQPLEGFTYASVSAPAGNEWESPENLALNKEQPHAYFFSFQNLESARKVLPENSKFWQSLDGDWKFHWASNPDARPKDFYQTDFDVTSWDVIPCRPVGIFMVFRKTEAGSMERLFMSINRLFSSIV